MSEHTLNELADAEVVPGQGGENAWLVRFGEGEYDLVNKTPKHRLILEDGVDLRGAVEYGGVEVEYDLSNDAIVLHRDGDEAIVPSENHEHVLWSIHDEDGPRLHKLFDKLYTPSVRRGVMDWFMPRFRQSDEIRKVDDGWLIDDILISWDASNHPASLDETHVVSGGEAVKADTEKQAREIRFGNLDNITAFTPDGRSIELDEVEAQFLVTASLVLNRGINPLYDDDLADAIENSEIVGFTDTKSGLYHSHTPDKHDLRDLGVTEEAIGKLWSNSNDHTGVVEMAMRKNEFSNAPFSVFEDAANDDPDKWSKIHSTKEKAPIPSDTRSMLEEMYT